MSGGFCGDSHHLLSVSLPRQGSRRGGSCCLYCLFRAARAAAPCLWPARRQHPRRLTTCSPDASKRMHACMQTQCRQLPDPPLAPSADLLLLLPVTPRARAAASACDVWGCMRSSSSKCMRMDIALPLDMQYFSKSCLSSTAAAAASAAAAAAGVCCVSKRPFFRVIYRQMP